MDELAALAGVDPLEFRLAHLDEPRLRPVLEAAAEKFQLARARGKEAAEPRRRRGVQPGQGLGRRLLRRGRSEPRVRATSSVLEVCEAFECGKVLNPDNLAFADRRRDRDGPRPGARARK